MQAKIMPTQAELLELFDYRDGRIYWRKSVNSKAQAGVEAGSVNGQGYRYVGINGKNYPTHRIIWVMHKGEIPEGLQIDHRFGNRSDNRIENIRLVTREENAINRKTNKDNTSGHKGVTWHKATGKWQARICVNRKYIYLGLFDILEEAHQAYEAASLKYHKDYRRKDYSER